MTGMRLTAACVLMLGSVAAPARAGDGDVIEYCARLSAADHFSSAGARLTSPGAVIRQDRANYHQFGVRDPEDQGDPIFADKTSREALQRRLDDAGVRPRDRSAIVDGAPYVCVAVEGDAVSVVLVN